MTTTAHLSAIKTKCHELLAIAERRTPGRITYDKPSGSMFAGDVEIAEFVLSENAAFIASAAGPFEASLRSTIAAIDLILDCGYTGCETTHLILAAWPLELLDSTLQ